MNVKPNAYKEPINFFRPSLNLTRSFEKKFSLSGVSNKLNGRTISKKREFNSYRWRYVSLGCIPFFHTRSTSPKLPEFLKRKLRKVMTLDDRYRFRMPYARVNGNTKFSLLLSLKLAFILGTHYALSVDRLMPKNFSSNLKALNLRQIVKRKRIVAKRLGAKYKANATIQTLRGRTRATIRTRSSLWLNNLYGWSALQGYGAGYGLMLRSERKMDDGAREALVATRFWESLDGYQSGLVRLWNKDTNNLTYMDKLLKDSQGRIHFMMSAMRLRTMKSHSIFFRYIELFRSKRDLTRYGWERARSIRLAVPIKQKARYFAYKSMMFAVRRLRIRKRRQNIMKFRVRNRFKKTMLMRKHWRSLWSIKRHYQLKNFLIAKFSKYAGYKLQRFTNIYVFRVDNLLCRLFRVRNIKFARLVMLKGHVRVNGRVTWYFSANIKRFDVLTLSKAAKNWIKSLRKRITGTRARRFWKAGRGRALTRKRGFLSAFIVNPFGAVLCSPRRARLRGHFLRASGRLTQNQCTFLYRTIFR